MRLLVLLLLTFRGFAAASRASIDPLPLAFEAHDEQYVSHGAGYSLSVTRDGASFKVRENTIQMRLVGSNPHAPLEPLDRMPGRTNYILGADVRASFALYGQLRSRGVYPGTDLVFRGNQERLEYDFEIAPGRNPHRIVLEFDGADELRIDGNGDLLLRTAAGEIRQPKPLAYQSVAGQKIPIGVAYQLDAAHHVRFLTEPYDHKRALVIDPQLIFDNVFGGSAGNSAADLARDAQGNIYVTGQTNSADFAIEGAAQGHPGLAPLLWTSDGGQTFTAPAIGVSSVQAVASGPAVPKLLYAATNLGAIKSNDGGTTWTLPANSGLPAPLISIAVDAGASSLLYGATLGNGVFVSSDGAATWNAANNGLGLLLSGTMQNVAASPSKPGTVFAIARPPQSVFRSTDSGQSWIQLNLPPLDRNDYGLALTFSPTDANTLFLGQPYGGILKSSDGGDTWAALSNETILSPEGLAVGPGSVMLAISTPGLQRSADGGQTWTTVLPLGFGSVMADPRNSNAVYAFDSSGLYRSIDAGQAWAKTTLVSALPQQFSLFVSPADSRVFIANRSQVDAFVTKWSPDGKQVLYSTYLGGSAAETPTGIAVDSAGSAYIAGYTQSTDFPLTSNAFQKTVASGGSAFVTKLSADGSQLVYSTLLGTSFVQTGRIAVDGNGRAAVAGNTPLGEKLGPVASCNGNSITMFVPTTGNAFLAMIAADGGSLIYSAQLGGSCSSFGQGVGIDANGSAWLMGSTTSPDFPVTQDALQSQFGGGVYDGFLARYDPSGNLSYATYLGGNRYDVISAIAFDTGGDLYLTGTSGGLPQPASAGAFQPQVNANCIAPFGNCSSGDIGPGAFHPSGSAFVLKLDPAAHTVLGLTYLGSYSLFSNSIALDPSGAVWVAGALSGAPSYMGGAPPTVAPFQIGVGGGFISKFSADLTQVLFSTYFDVVGGFALDSAGSAYVAGGGVPLLGIPGTLPPKAFVAKIDPAAPAISLDSVQSTVSAPFSTIAPGELVRIIGKNMGPTVATSGVVQAGVLANSVAGVQVIFDGTPVPLLSVSAQEIDFVAPLELSAETATRVQVKYNGVSSNPVQVGVTSAVMQILGVLNDDFTPNSASTPAKAGSVMTLYVSGLGQTSPPSQDGQVNRAPLPSAAMPVQITFAPLDHTGQAPLPVTFAGAAPGLVAGILQINFLAPPPGVTAVNIAIGDPSITSPSTASLNVSVQ